MILILGALDVMRYDGFVYGVLFPFRFFALIYHNILYYNVRIMPGTASEGVRARSCRGFRAEQRGRRRITQN